MATEPTNLRLDADMKAEAYEIFNRIGIKPAQAFNLFLRQVTLHKGLPFAVKIPNADTIVAIEELENGGGTYHKTAEDMYKDLGI